jgi:hypothetical protein
MRKYGAKLQRFLFLEPSVRRFKRLAKKSRPKTKKSTSVLLIEKRYWPDGEISLLSFLHEATVFYNATPVVYEMYPEQSGFHLKRKVRYFFSVLNSIFPSKYILISGFPGKDFNHSVIAEGLLSGNLSKEQFQNYKYRDVLIGDLIYDHYLRRARKPTLNFNDPALRFFILEFLIYVDKFIEIFDCQKVSALVVSHTTYHFGIPARISLQRKIPTYLVDLTNALRLNDISLYGYTTDWQSYKSELSQFSERKMLEIRNIGKRCVSLRLSGENLPQGIPSNSYRTSNFTLDSKVDGRQGAKVLVALHDFFDAVHAAGNAFFPDYYEWLLEICKISQNSNLTWIIKPHPAELRDTSELLLKLKSEFPHLIIVPSDTDNSMLVEYGVKYCLTIYGSISSELPELGVTVINATAHNPHADFEFCVTPKDRHEYIKILKNLETLQFKINQDHLYEYNYMRFMHHIPSWCISDFNSFLDTVGSMREIDYEAAFSWYFKSGEQELLMCVRAAVREFLIGKEYKLISSHFDRSTCKCGNSCNFLKLTQLSV